MGNISLTPLRAVQHCVIELKTFQKDTEAADGFKNKKYPFCMSKVMSRV